MRLFYFPDMPIDEVQPASVVVYPERYATPDAQTKQVKLQRMGWQKLYGVQLPRSLTLHGQLNPCHVSWYPKYEQWLIEPGQTRWWAMKELGFDTFRVLLKVDERPHPFSRHDCTELHTMTEVMPLYQSGDKVRNLYGSHWFRKMGWALPDIEGERVAVG